MFKRNMPQSHLEDTQPIDHDRLANKFAEEKKRQKANDAAKGCLLLLTIAIAYIAVTLINSSQSSSTVPLARSVAATNPAKRVFPTRTSSARARTAVPTVAPTTAPSYLFHVCSDRLVNMRKGAGYSNYAIAGEMLPGQSYPVLAHSEGENVQGNTTWYQIADGGKTAYVTAFYTYVCDDTAPVLEPARDPAEQATIDYISTCKDRNGESSIF